MLARSRSNFLAAFRKVALAAAPTITPDGPHRCIKGHRPRQRATVRLACDAVILGEGADPWHGRLLDREGPPGRFIPSEDRLDCRAAEDDHFAARANAVRRRRQVVTLGREPGKPPPPTGRISQRSKHSRRRMSKVHSHDSALRSGVDEVQPDGSEGLSHSQPYCACNADDDVTALTGVSRSAGRPARSGRSRAGVSQWGR